MYIQKQMTLLFVFLDPSHRNQTEINIPKIELKGHKILGAPANLHMPRLCEFCQTLSRAPYHTAGRCKALVNFLGEFSAIEATPKQNPGMKDNSINDRTS